VSFSLFYFRSELCAGVCRFSFSAGASRFFLHEGSVLVVWFGLPASSSSAFACISFYLAILLRSGFVLRQILPPICTAVPLRSSRSQLSLADLIFQLTSPSCRPSCLLVLPSRTGQVPGFFVPARGWPRFLLAAIFVLGQLAFSAKLLRSRRQKIFLCRCSVSLLVRRFVQIWSPAVDFYFLHRNPACW
jgi:hypothetical protein